CTLPRGLAGACRLSGRLRAVWRLLLRALPAGCAGLSRWILLWGLIGRRLIRPRGLSLLARAAFLLLIARLLPVRRAGLLCALSVRALPVVGRTLLRLAGTVLSGRAVRPLLIRLVAAIGRRRIGATEGALLNHDLSAGGLRRMHLPHEALITQ